MRIIEGSGFVSQIEILSGTSKAVDIPAVAIPG